VSSMACFCSVVFFFELFWASALPHEVSIATIMAVIADM
jgi:hypothetical protein